MNVRMTSTAYVRGVRNALICGLAVLASWLLLAWAIEFLAGRPVDYVRPISYALLCGLIFVVFFVSWLRELSKKGTALLDCGPHPTQRAFSLIGILFLIASVAGFTVWPELPTAVAAAFGIAFGMYWLVMASGRLQVCDNGIWVYWGLLPWNKISSYQWSGDSTFLYEVNRPVLLSRGALPVPPQHRDEFDRLLRAHCGPTARAVVTVVRVV